jgi:hypothetical protein
MQYLLLDNYILLSIVNTKLRDFYRSLDELCSEMGINKERLIAKLYAIGYVYKAEHNQFISMMSTENSYE